MGADREELGHFTEAAVATPPPAVTVEPLVMASKKQPACGLAGEASCLRRVEQVYAAYLVRHGATTFLIDAGIGRHVSEDYDRFSWFFRQAVRIEPVVGLGDLLAQHGSPAIDFVLLTHVHWDHSSGLRDLPGVKVVTSAADRLFIDGYRGKEPAVMREHFQGTKLETFAWDGPAYEDFPSSHDMFGDGSVVLVPMPGHTPGSIGIFVNNVKGRRLFFVGDAVWNRDGIRLPSQKLKLMSKRVDWDANQVSDAIWRLHHLQERHPDLIIVPAHDGAALREVEALSTAK
jgi:glyoxylase-like metal-dependent hydrolase (beta-lactamase superfamily II)